MDDARVGHLIGYIYFNSYLILNITLLINLIIAQLAYAYKKYNRERNVFYLLSTLQVREISEVDPKNKYSAVVSAPFPLTILNILFGSIVLAAKNKYVNLALLHFYYLPLVLCMAAVFQVYQLIIGPFCFCLPSPKSSNWSISALRILSSFPFPSRSGKSGFVSDLIVG